MFGFLNGSSRFSRYVSFVKCILFNTCLFELFWIIHVYWFIYRNYLPNYKSFIIHVIHPVRFCGLCRYGLIEGKKDKFNLYTISIPVKRSQKPQPCYLTLWDSESFMSKGNQETGTEVLSSLALRYSQNCPNVELKPRFELHEKWVHCYSKKKKFHGNLCFFLSVKMVCMQQWAPFQGV